ncbi:MAG: PadR family transcriptional regulator [Nitrososphaerales archaeon]
MNPQTVPRGFLRLYLLSLLSRQPDTGYSIMRTIDEKTEGAWRPGPGTVYPLLRTLVKEGVIKTHSSVRKNQKSGVPYSLTEKGRRELQELQHNFVSAGRNQNVMMSLCVDIMPATPLMSMFVKRSHEMSEIMREKITEIPQPERDPILKEMRVVAENLQSWINLQLSKRTREKS